MKINSLISILAFVLALSACRGKNASKQAETTVESTETHTDTPLAQADVNTPFLQALASVPAFPSLKELVEKGINTYEESKTDNFLSLEKTEVLSASFKDVFNPIVGGDTCYIFGKYIEDDHVYVVGSYAGLDYANGIELAVFTPNGELLGEYGNYSVILKGADARGGGTASIDETGLLTIREEIMDVSGNGKDKVYTYKKRFDKANNKFITVK